MPATIITDQHGLPLVLPAEGIGFTDTASYDLVHKTLRKRLGYIGSGSSRVVYPVGEDRVLKVRGYLGSDSWIGGNTEEAEVYAALPESLRSYFTTVYAVAEDGSWLLAERVLTLNDCTARPRSDIPPIIREAIRDLHWMNIGRRASDPEQPVILDYAMRHENWQRVFASADKPARLRDARGRFKAVVKL